MLCLDDYRAGNEVEAKLLFDAYGFVILKERMGASLFEAVSSLKNAIVAKTMAEAVPSDGGGLTVGGIPKAGNRGHHRFSISSLGEYPFFEDVVAVPGVIGFLRYLWSSDDFEVADSGGDFCLGGCGLQNLHSDQKNFEAGYGREKYRELEASFVIVNFLMDDFREDNGPIRIVPGSHRSLELVPNQFFEPAAFRRNCLLAERGTILIRDARTWHGGTPSSASGARLMLGVGYFAPWYRGSRIGAGKPTRQTISLDRFREYNPQLQKLLRSHVRLP